MSSARDTLLKNGVKPLSVACRFLSGKCRSLPTGRDRPNLGSRAREGRGGFVVRRGDGNVRAMPRESASDRSEVRS